MFKAIASLICGAVFAGAVTFAYALTGQAPLPSNGFGPVDGTWLNGVAAGTNQNYLNGIIALGTTSATATVLPIGYYLYEVDSASASTGVYLPQCVAGTQLRITNASSNIISVYANNNNSVTGKSLPDTINGSLQLTLGIPSPTQLNAYATSFAVSPGTSPIVPYMSINYDFACASNGKWFH